MVTKSIQERDKGSDAKERGLEKTRDDLKDEEIGTKRLQRRRIEGREWC